MSDTLDLRKRILKMREINKIDPKTIDSFNSINQDSDLIQTKKGNISEYNPNDIKNKKLIKTKTNEYIHNKSFDLVLNSKKRDENNYEAQFRLLANKFNEAVEVILELSDKVKNLEKTVYLKDKKNNKKSKYNQIPNLKIIVSIILIFLFALGVIYLPINTLMLKSILSDISSSI